MQTIMQTELQEIHFKNSLTFQDKLMRKDKPHSTACNVFDKLTENRNNCADCLGENFNSLINLVTNNFFDQYEPKANTDLEYYFNSYIFWLYIFKERIEFVFKTINPENKNQIFHDYYKKNFKTMSLINKWMNFIKHPKQFIYCHWPTYVMSNVIFDDISSIQLIHSGFIQDHYSTPESQPKKLENCRDVYVQIPDLILLTESFCNELNSFFDFIAKNDLVAEYFKPKTTIDNYYNG